MSPNLPRDHETDDPLVIRLPCDFGQIVYRRAGVQTAPGIVSAFNAFDGNLKLRVEWGISQDYHYPFELTLDAPTPEKSQ
jgi:hypothetical protein